MRDSHSSAIERGGAANFEKRRQGRRVRSVVISSEFSAARNKPTYGRRCGALAGYRVSSFRGQLSRNGQKQRGQFPFWPHLSIRKIRSLNRLFFSTLPRLPIACHPPSRANFISFVCDACQGISSFFWRTSISFRFGRNGANCRNVDLTRIEIRAIDGAKLERERKRD